MDLIAFRVSMYKGIIDSDWIDVNSLTVFVGKNESGKTSLLKALYKLNPYEPDPYEMEKEWPRGRLAECSEEHVVCQARFELLDQEKLDLVQISGIEEIPDIVEASRNYKGQLKVNFEGGFSLEEPVPAEIDTAPIDVIIDSLPKVRSDFSPAFEKCADECLDETRHLVSENQFIELGQLAQKHKPLLQDHRSRSTSNSYNFEGQFINQYIKCLDQIVEALQLLPIPKSKIDSYLIKYLPAFIYMDDYRTFTGTAQLDEIKDRQDNNSLTEEDKTFLTILNLSGIDLDQLVQLGKGDEKAIKKRQNLLVGGGESLTKIISPRFSQQDYRIDYRVDGNHFFTNVKDSHDPTAIELEERSKGYQWFFSFDLMLTHETKGTNGTFKNCVILFDEPGLHLHPGAQKDLLRRLEEYATENRLLYTTHLPFMIDLNYPDRIRILKEAKKGIIVTTNLTETTPEAKLVLQAALGMDASQSFLIAERNLIVEGVHDYWLLTELSNVLRRNGENGLPEDVFITPGGSASTAVNIATFMIGQKLSVVALFDSDEAGRNAQKKLKKNWIAPDNKSQAKTILLGDAIGACDDFELEDLFSQDFYLEAVRETYKKELTFAGVTEITLQGKGTLWKKVEGSLKKYGIKNPHKGSVARRLRNKLSRMKELNELADETKDKIIKLFDAIRTAFEEQESD